MAYGTFTLTGTYKTTLGVVHAGVAKIVPSAELRDAASNVILAGVELVPLDGTGSFSKVLPADDGSSLQPSPFGYTVIPQLYSASATTKVFAAPAPGTVLDMADIPDGQVPVPATANPATAQDLAALSATFESVFRPEAYGSAGIEDGAVDAVNAVRSAFAAANAEMRAGVAAGIMHPGATVVLKGTYNLATLAAPIDVSCNVRGSGAALIAPQGYAGVVLRVGHPTSGSILQCADITLPDVLKPSSDLPLVAGSVGVRVQNLYNSRLAFGRTAYFENAIHLTGLGNGTVYNEIHIGWVSYSKVSIRLAPDTGGWVNQNTFVGGGVQQSANFAGGGLRRTGWRHLVLDGGAINAINGNSFVGVSFEGDVSEYVFELISAYDNNWLGCRHEQGTLGVAVTVSGSTLTSVAHGLTVGDAVSFAASSLPGGMANAAPYFVVTVPTSDTFSVSFKKGGTAITFTSGGSSVLWYRPQLIRLDGTVGIGVVGNTFDRPTVAKPLAFSIAGTPDSNVVRTALRSTIDGLVAEDAPLFRARNRSGTATVRAAFAAYAAAVDPAENPQGWTAALSDRGLLFAAAETETGRLFNSGGIMQYRRPADSAAFDVASCRRCPSLVTVSGLSLTASTTTATTLTLTGASVRDHVTITTDADLPAGVAVAWARVSAADTVRVGFLNSTGSTVSLTVDLQLMITRRFF